MGVITNFLITVNCVLALALSMKFLTAGEIGFDGRAILFKYEIWRLILPPLCGGPLTVSFLWQILCLAEIGTKYERLPYTTGGGNTADMLWMLIITVVFWPFMTHAFQPRDGQPVPFVSESLLIMIMYVWSRKSPADSVHYFGIKIPSLYVPWVYMIVSSLLSYFHPFTHEYFTLHVPIVLAVQGLFMGHIYYFLVDFLPDRWNEDVISTPLFLTKFVDAVGLENKRVLKEE